MRHVKLTSEQLIGNRVHLPGEIVSLPDAVADRYQNGGHGTIVPEPGIYQTTAAAPAPEQATLPRRTAPRKRK